MDEKSILAREAAREQRAQHILNELQLIDRWKKFGKPYLVGAVSYNLVVAPDLDLEVYCPGDPRIEDGFEVMQACALHPRVRQVHFSNHLHDADQGYYWQLHYLDEDGTDWKVDMWSVRADYALPTSRDMVEPMRQALTGETRAAILSIKEQLRARPDVHCISIYVYQAVLAGGVRTLDEFLRWRSEHAEEGLVSWKPEPANKNS